MRGYELNKYLEKVDCIADEINMDVKKKIGECINSINKGFTGENGYKITSMCELISDNLISISNDLKMLK